jgi:hypothetical protein
MLNRGKSGLKDGSDGAKLLFISVVDVIQSIVVNSRVYSWERRTIQSLFDGVTNVHCYNYPLSISLGHELVKSLF